ncbi:MAG: SsrA-binding protein SmpB [Patescibacteria group bacterium]
MSSPILSAMLCYHNYVSTLIHNRKVHFTYEILERFEAGIVLSGQEVKSLRKGQGSLEGSYIIIRGGEAYIMHMQIPPYQVGNVDDYDPLQNRKLLLTRNEIAKLAGLVKGLTIVPITVYNKGHKIKVEIATVRGKKQFDKRESIKKRDTERQIRREYKDR